MELPDEQTLQELLELARDTEQKGRAMYEAALALELKCEILADRASGPLGHRDPSPSSARS